METRLISNRPETLGSYLSRCWHNRSLIGVLAGREIRVQYSQTILGLGWSILQPLVAIAIYSLFFYYLLGIETEIAPYPLFVLPGIIAWFNFTQVIGDCGTVLQANSDLIRKVGFPKIILLIGKTIAISANAGIGTALLVILQLLFGHPFSWQFVFFPVFLVLSSLAGLSIAVWLSALTIKFRDFNHIIPYLVSFGIWVTPVFFPTTIIPAAFEKYIYLNPMAFIISGLRWSFLGGEFPPFIGCASLLAMLMIGLGGLIYFQKVEREIVDYV